NRFRSRHVPGNGLPADKHVQLFSNPAFVNTEPGALSNSDLILGSSPDYLSVGPACVYNPGAPQPGYPSGFTPVLPTARRCLLGAQDAWRAAAGRSGSAPGRSCRSISSSSWSGTTVITASTDGGRDRITR